MLFKEEFVSHVQIRVITDLRPSTKAMSVDANQEHSIFLGAPGARIACSLCRIRKTERVPVTVTADGLSKKLKLLGPLNGCLGIHLLEVAKINQYRLAILLGEALSKSLLFLNHLAISLLSVTTLDSGSSWCALGRYLGNIGFVLLLFLLSFNLGDLISRNNLIPIKIDVINFDVGDLHEVVPVNATSTEINLVVNLGLGDFSIFKDRVNVELFETLLVAALLKHLGRTHFEHHLNILR
ncbi:hypothetical protein HG530_003251 [Fusarium avenaceum]|nr:hypothetical protein HG530_003251 [Fusarium avenaceum]